MTKYLRYFTPLLSNHFNFKVRFYILKIINYCCITFVVYELWNYINYSCGAKNSSLRSLSIYQPFSYSFKIYMLIIITPSYSYMWLFPNSLSCLQLMPIFGTTSHWLDSICNCPTKIVFLHLRPTKTSLLTARSKILFIFSFYSTFHQ